MFKLAHISDIHLAPLPPVAKRELMSKRITGYVNWQRNRRSKNDPFILDNLVSHLKQAKPDHIAVTGDLVNLALDAEFVETRNWLDRLGPAKDVSVIPGNHDCYVRSAIDTACEHWQPFMLGDGDRFAVQFPYLRERDNVAIIGANSGHVSPPFYATGIFDGTQADKISNMLDKTGSDGKFRVVMIHHPPFPKATATHKRLIGSTRFRAMIAEHGADLVLHGHTHIDSLQWIEGPSGKVPVVGVPSASHAPPALNASSGLPGARYNLFSISGSAEKWHCRMQEFGYGPGSREVTLIAERELI